MSAMNAMNGNLPNRVDTRFGVAVHIVSREAIAPGATAGLFLHSHLLIQFPRRARPRAVPAANKIPELVSVVESHRSREAFMSFTRFVAALLLILAAIPALAQQEIAVAAAADLQFVMPEIVTRFEKQTGNHVKVSFGSSGNFFTQLENGAPFDVFFSADRQYAEKLEQAGSGEQGTLRDYAVGKLVLWVRNDSKLDVSKGLKALLDPAVSKIALANPAHAPYGRAAVAALQHEGSYDELSKKFVLGENISQTASFVSSGNADAGLIALSLAVAPSMKDKGRYFEIPTADYPPIVQAAIALKNSQHKALARQFLDFANSSEVQDLWRKYGFAKRGQ